MQKIDSRIKTPRGQYKHTGELDAQESTEAIKAYLGQDFYTLREEYYRKGKPFEDPEFPISRKFIDNEDGEKIEIIWKRPHVFHTSLFVKFS